MIKSIITTLLLLGFASFSNATTFTVKHLGGNGNGGGGYTGIFFRLGQLKQNKVNVITIASDELARKRVEEIPNDQLYIQSITINGRVGAEYLNTFDKLGYVVFLDDDFDATLAILNRRSFSSQMNPSKKFCTLTIDLHQLQIKVKDTYKIDFYDQKKAPLRLQLQATRESSAALNTPVAGYRLNKIPNSNGFIPSGIQIICSDTPSE